MLDIRMQKLETIILVFKVLAQIFVFHTFSGVYRRNLVVKLIKNVFLIT